MFKLLATFTIGMLGALGAPRPDSLPLQSVACSAVLFGPGSPAAEPLPGQPRTTLVVSRATGAEARAHWLDSVEPAIVKVDLRSVGLPNRGDETQAQSLRATRSRGAPKPAPGKPHGARGDSGNESDRGSCESPDERIRSHCLIYMKLRAGRS